MRDLWKAIRTLPAEDWRRAALIAAITTCAAMIFPAAAMAQALNVNLGTGADLTERVVQMIGLLTVLSLAPSIVIMTTSFVRIVVVLSLLRTALGLQQSPPNAVIISLALFLTAIVMGPTFTNSYNAGVKPLLDHQMELPQAFGAASGSLRCVQLHRILLGMTRRQRITTQALTGDVGEPSVILGSEFGNSAQLVTSVHAANRVLRVAHQEELGASFKSLLDGR